MSFPIYILDDDTIIFTKKDLNHVEFWEDEVCEILSQKTNIPKKRLINLPYCQRRARIVGEHLYFGEKISKVLLKKISKTVSVDLKFVYDEHEKRLSYDVSKFKSLSQ